MSSYGHELIEPGLKNRVISHENILNLIHVKVFHFNNSTGDQSNMIFLWRILICIEIILFEELDKKTFLCIKNFVNGSALVAEFSVQSRLVHQSEY